MTSKLTITDERLAELVAFKPLPGTDINSATRDEWMAMAAELHERRKADSEPVAWEYEEYVYVSGLGHLWREKLDCEFPGIECGTLRGVVPLYRHAQQPVVPDAYVRDERGRMMLNGVCEPKIGFGAGWNACRAAMLQAGNSPVIGIDPASGPDRTVEVRYVSPPGYVMVPKEPTPEMLEVINEAIKSMRGSAATYARVLAAAPQEVPDGK